MIPVFSLSHSCLVIYDSYLVKSKKDMKTILNTIKMGEGERGHDCNIFKIRSIDNMVAEWAVHNLCYNLHILRSRTKDVDINDIDKFHQFIYKVFSIFYI